MTFMQLLPSFKNGQPIQRKTKWESNEYCGIDEEGMYWKCGHVGMGTVTIDFVITIEDLEAVDWQLYFSPKKLLSENQK